MLFQNFVFASLAATFAVAAPMHKHHEHKRAVETVYVTVGADGVQKQAAPTAAAAEPLAAIAIPTADSAAPSASASASASDASSSGSSSSGVGAAGAKGVTYTPYTTGPCKSAEQVKADIAQLSGFDIIRLYGVDCNQIENVIAALGDHQKVFLGVAQVNQLDSELETLISAVKSAGGWSKVDTISIGNELVNSGQKTPAQMKEYVNKAKATLQGAGYNGPVTTVDTFIKVINNPEMCDIGDYITVNAHAYFDGGYSADQAGEWVLGQIQRVATACPGKRVLVTESGWPSQGIANKKAVASKENQKAAIASIKEKCGDATFLFSAFDEDWKQDRADTFNAECHWGIL